MPDKPMVDEATLARIRAEETEKVRHQLAEQAEQEARERIRAELLAEHRLAEADPAVGTSPGGPPLPPVTPVQAPDIGPSTGAAQTRPAVQPWVIIILCSLVARFVALFGVGLITEVTGWSNFFWLRIADTLIGAAAVWGGMSMAREPKEGAAWTLAGGWIIVYLITAAVTMSEVGWLAWGEALLLAIGSGAAAGAYSKTEGDTGKVAVQG